MIIIMTLNKYLHSLGLLVAEFRPAAGNSSYISADYISLIVVRRFLPAIQPG